MARIYLLFYLLCIIDLAQAQGLPGYVLTQAGDSLLGNVAEKSGQRVYLYPAAGGRPQLFRADQIRGYGLTNQLAVRRRNVRLATGADSMLLVAPTQVGTASLYANGNNLLLLPPAADTLYELTPTNWHLLFNRYLSGCPTLVQSDPEVLRIRFSEVNVRQMLARYNQCLAPGWKNATTYTSMWRQSFGLQIAPMRIVSSQTYRAPGTSATGWGGQLGLEWIHTRASGLQITLSGGYLYLPLTTPSYTVTGPSNQPAEERFRVQSNLATVGVSLGKRLGRPQRPNLYGGLGVGFNYRFHERTTYQLRTSTSGGDFQDSFSLSDAGGITLHFNAVVGVLLPISNRQEVRLAAEYRNYSYNNISSIGLQLAYCWMHK